MSTTHNTTTEGWGAALLRALAYNPWVTFMVPPTIAFSKRRERSGR
jgi:hypothetical protein